jgi:hypothetical protein
LGAEYCAAGLCRCCDRHRGQRDTLRLHEFFSRLRPEFEVVRSQLLTRRPRPSLDEAMPELRAEETRLRAGGISFVHCSSTAIAATVHRASVCLLWQVSTHRGCLSEEAARQEDSPWGVQCSSLCNCLGAGGPHVVPPSQCCCFLTLCHYCSGFWHYCSGFWDSTTTTSSLRYIIQVVS